MSNPQNTNIMNKTIFLIGVFFSLLGYTSAQENKDTKFFQRKSIFTWDVISPVYTIDGDTTTYLEIATTTQIEAISFVIEWQLKGGEIIRTSEKSVLRHGSIPWDNDLPQIFPLSSAIWYNIYILPGPPISVWDIEKIRFSGQFLTENRWNNMGLNEALCHQQ